MVRSCCDIFIAVQTLLLCLKDLKPWHWQLMLGSECVSMRYHDMIASTISMCNSVSDSWQSASSDEEVQGQSVPAEQLWTHPLWDARWPVPQKEYLLQRLAASCDIMQQHFEIGNFGGIQATHCRAIDLVACAQRCALWKHSKEKRSSSIQFGTHSQRPSDQV